ncbi:MAG: bifunctional phosphopantothenoylcysteine decarboxylase/phosphopantothenate--cysteine ligase CoaBC [Hyphomicrobiales bacterium]|nr:bifunctional phosphopantothenoylcysteine decarboxylase/phosphopantothenate--cysteine ligase CoaBC [Hyphomicrobiales bacterium]MBV9434047.1 bifunctional phosphopantothenoylcysteine decarboxylase/phosphopantothenate--cysteine ligase CoaBC [Hyphomicrobiales bacterium]
MKRVLLIIGGGIAAYKTLELIRALRKRGLAVRCILTRAGKEFVTPLALSSLSGDKVYEDLFSLTDEAEMGHIELSRDADLLVVAPATADLLAKMASGAANDLASTALLATDKPILAAPAMNVRMWLHAATQRNFSRLEGDGVRFVGPGKGEMACGEFGPGRMAEPVEIADAIEAMLGVVMKGKPLTGRRVVVTSGPTLEPIDPVRFLSNRSSGRQGHAIAAAAAAAGAEVVLVSGPVSIPDPAGVRTVHVEAAVEMLAAVEAALPCDIAVFCAAVADWRVEPAWQKIKKGTSAPTLALIENPDILARIGHHSRRPRLVIGFAAETEKMLDHARAKLARKGCDMIIANDVGEAGVMGGERNTVHLVTANGVEDWPTLDKAEVARRLVERMAALIDGSR